MKKLSERSYITIRDVKIYKGDIVSIGDFSIGGSKLPIEEIIITDIFLRDRYSYATCTNSDGSYRSGTLMEDITYPYFIEIKERNENTKMSAM